MNFIYPSRVVEPRAPDVDVEALLHRYAMALDAVRDLERYHDALELIRDHSTDMQAVALANNVLMGLNIEYGFFVYPARPKLQ